MSNKRVEALGMTEKCIGSIGRVEALGVLEALDVLQTYWMPLVSCKPGMKAVDMFKQ